MLPSKHISTSINCSPEEVYAFASNPANLPKWAGGLSESIQYRDGAWIAESPMGTVKVEFTPTNTLGVLDHIVTLPSGVSVYNPFRVIPNAEGSEVIFTLYRQPNMSEQQFTDDATLVSEDLARLKEILEG